jgi:hypothetical protein
VPGGALAWSRYRAVEVSDETRSALLHHLPDVTGKQIGGRGLARNVELDPGVRVLLNLGKLHEGNAKRRSSRSRANTLGVVNWELHPRLSSETRSEGVAPLLRSRCSQGQ